MNEKDIPQEPKRPLGPQELHNFEDAEARWQDGLRWGNEIDYTYPASGWDVLMPMDEKDIDNLTRYSG